MSVDVSHTVTRRRPPNVRARRSHRTPGFEWLSRAGFVARAAIYLIIGVLALELAVGVGGKATNQQGALQTLARQPFGKVLLVLVAVGLAGYAAWRLTRAALGHGPKAPTAVSTASPHSAAGSSTRVSA